MEKVWGAGIVLGVEFRVLCLLGRGSTCHITSPINTFLDEVVLKNL
jgi:hypothetical protein